MFNNKGLSVTSMNNNRLLTNNIKRNIFIHVRYLPMRRMFFPYLFNCCSTTVNHLSSHLEDLFC